MQLNYFLLLQLKMSLLLNQTIISSNNFYIYEYDTIYDKSPYAINAIYIHIYVYNMYVICILTNLRMKEKNCIVPILMRVTGLLTAGSNSSSM